jgi:hypothetical protein
MNGWNTLTLMGSICNAQVSISQPAHSDNDFYLCFDIVDNGFQLVSGSAVPKYLGQERQIKQHLQCPFLSHFAVISIGQEALVSVIGYLEQFGAQHINACLRFCC